MAFAAGGPNRRSLRDRLREGIQIPFQAKSRSVDQSFHLNNPFADLDIISRVTNTGHGKQREDSTSSTNSSSDTPTSMSPFKHGLGSGGGSSINPNANNKKQEAITYTVKDNDTITSVSASFDITPSELIKTNRLSTRAIFPGQVLRIPPKHRISTPNNSPIKGHNLQSDKGSNASGSSAAAAAASIVAGISSGQFHSSGSAKPEASRKFIKINVKHITDGNGVVSGTLLVTPNAVMFDPNVSDPLVIEQGAETYGVILPLEIIVHAGIYSDIAFMKVKGKDFIPPGPRPDLYPLKSSVNTSASEGTTVVPVALDVLPPLTSTNPIASSAEILTASTTETTAISSTTISDSLTSLTSSTAATNTIESEVGDSTNSSLTSKAHDAERIKETGNRIRTSSGGSSSVDRQLSSTSTEFEIVHDSGFETGRPSPATVLPDDSSAIQPIPEESRKQKVLKRLSFPLTWMESLGGQSAKEETQSAPPESKINYRSLVSMDDMPDLFASIDKLMPRQMQINRENDDYPPWFLCLSMGKPKHRKVRSLIVSYGQKKSIKPEYWFSIPKNQVEDLYKFWMLWWPHLYGELDPALVEERGYELVDWDTDLFGDDEECVELDKPEDSNSAFDSIAQKGEQLGELTKESWEMIKAPYVKFYSFIRSQTLLSGGDEDYPEVVSMSEELRRALYGSEEFIPELIGVSEILEETDIKNLGQHLTARAEGYPWLLAFSTSRDGFSLNSLYRKMQGVESPVLILVQDTKLRVFGALVSCALHVSDHFYGTGQSFLFNCRPEFQVFKWTGENMYFIKGNYESLSIGAGDGKFGLWLDGDLFVGRTEECSTYGNPALVEENDFVIKTLECWIFGRPFD